MYEGLSRGMGLLANAKTVLQNRHDPSLANLRASWARKKLELEEQLGPEALDDPVFTCTSTNL